MDRVRRNPDLTLCNIKYSGHFHLITSTVFTEWFFSLYFLIKPLTHTERLHHSEAPSFRRSRCRGPHLASRGHFVLWLRTSCFDYLSPRVFMHLKMNLWLSHPILYLHFVSFSACSVNIASKRDILKHYAFRHMSRSTQSGFSVPANVSARATSNVTELHNHTYMIQKTEVKEILYIKTRDINIAGHLNGALDLTLSL